MRRAFAGAQRPLERPPDASTAPAGGERLQGTNCFGPSRGRLGIGGTASTKPSTPTATAARPRAPTNSAAAARA